jgi:glycosyltransferase involved in cell wall biosynthesis
MRVLMLTELYPPFIGGSEEYVRNLSRGLVARGHQVSVATVAADNQPSTTDEDGVTVHRVRSSTGRVSALMPSGRPYHAPAPDPDVTLALRQIVRDEKPDVVHAHNWMVSSFLPIKSTSDAALVMTMHDYSIVCAKRSLFYKGTECSGPGFSKCLHCAATNYGTARGELITLATWASAPVLRRTVDYFIPVSRAVAQRNELANDSDVAYEVVPNFVPDDVVSTANAEHPALADLPANGFWLYVGALSKHKGVHVLLDAYAGIPGAPPLVIVGRQSPEAPVDLPAGVIQLTDLPHDAVMAVWKRAALGIVPSLFPDPCPTVVLEAMAAGVPVVGSRNGGMSDMVIDGESGFLVEAGAELQLREALCRVLVDEPGRKKMAAAAKKRAPQFMASSVVPRIEAIYAKVVG